MTPFVGWLLFLFAVTAFVGFFSGIILGLFWAIRCALGLESRQAKEELEIRRALRGFGLIVAGIVAGGIVVLSVGLVPFVTTVLLIQGLFGEDPPALAATVSFGLLIGIALLAAVAFARWWQGLVWTHVSIDRG